MAVLSLSPCLVSAPASALTYPGNGATHTHTQEGEANDVERGTPPVPREK